MRFKGLDLNLLVALDRLLTERNVSRAADKLCLSQSATSGALARARDYFGDELLVQVGRRMVLTPRAIELSMAIRSALMQIDATIIDQPALDLATVKRNVRIITSDYIGIAYLSGVLRAVQAEAPDISFTLIAPSSNATTMMSSGEAEFAVMPERLLLTDHPWQVLFTDDHTVIVDRDHRPPGDVLDLDTFMSRRQVSVQLADGPPVYEMALTERCGQVRKIDVLASNFTSVPFFVVGTARAAIMYRRLARIACQNMRLQMYDPPLDLPQLSVALQWHRLADNDQVLRFIRTRILEHSAAEETTGHIA